MATTVPAGGGILLSGISYSPGWRAEVDGDPIGRAVPLSVQSAWVLPEGATQVNLDYPSQRIYRVATAATFLGLALCAWLLLRRGSVA